MLGGPLWGPKLVRGLLHETGTRNTFFFLIYKKYFLFFFFDISRNTFLINCLSAIIFLWRLLSYNMWVSYSHNIPIDFKCYDKFFKSSCSCPTLLPLVLAAIIYCSCFYGVGERDTPSSFYILIILVIKKIK